MMGWEIIQLGWSEKYFSVPKLPSFLLTQPLLPYKFVVEGGISCGKAVRGFLVNIQSPVQFSGLS